MTEHETRQHRSSIKSDWLLHLVSDCLKTPANQIDDRVPLTRYGLDSLNAVRLSAAIATELQCDVPETLLLDYPDFHSLHEFVYKLSFPDQVPASVINRSAEISFLDRLLADSVLPLDVHPAHTPDNGCHAKTVLLTGATGFLGTYILRSLLRNTKARIVCLVRAADDESLDRVRSAMSRYAIWDRSYESRISVIAGDLQQPGLALSAANLASIIRDVGEVYHCGAAVNWVLPYDALRDVNVRGTLELLRVACLGNPKSFHFVSSMAACYSTSGPPRVTELDDMLPYLNGIHLGYAQTKCVAESLVRQAGERGLSTTIHRPTLIAGDSFTGISNPDDLLWSMIRGCIQMGSAPDLDWALDCCPVDYVAESIVGLSRHATDRYSENSPATTVFHLSNSVTRHWRELVLWMNLFGYGIRLIPYREWLAQMRTSAIAPDHPLYRLRSFFLTRPPAANGLTLPQLYEDQHRSHVSQTRTENALHSLSLKCPMLNASLLDRYFTSSIAQQIIADVDRKPHVRSVTQLNADFFQGILREHYEDPAMIVRDVVNLRDSWQDSITTELTSWRYGTTAGLSQHRVTLDSRKRNVPPSLDLFVKVKPRDEDAIAVAESVASMCGSEIGRAFTRHRQQVGIAGCDTREVNLYRQQDSRFRRYVPKVYGTIDNRSQRISILVVESLTEMALMDTAADPSGWTPCHIEAAIQGIADIHSIWFGREQELTSTDWLGATMSSAKMAQMTDLWTALSDYASPIFSNWISTDIRPLMQGLISDVGTWWQSLEQMPRTLIHNDFNPRNIAFRDDSGNPRLCVYDWELATLGVPQHDLAELLCFVLRDDCAYKEVSYYVDAHREALQKASGQSLDPIRWRHGFQLSLADLILNRFPMYCLVNTFRRQSFLPRIGKTWRRLYELFRTDGL